MELAPVVQVRLIELAWEYATSKDVAIMQEHLNKTTLEAVDMAYKAFSKTVGSVQRT